MSGDSIMLWVFWLLFLLFLSCLTCHGATSHRSSIQHNPFVRARKERDWRTREEADALTVDLGYAVYEGVSNASRGINSWLGVRFAAPPTGGLQWQAPQTPKPNRDPVIRADHYRPLCPQSNPNAPDDDVGGQPGNEDCLFLNVYAPRNASGLPVYAWVHGGGYGQEDHANTDLTPFINSNNNRFIGVEFGYRLGAFGFLSSEDVFRGGVVNAGLLDVKFALQWVQAYIQEFGGDPTRVTTHGQSAGAGAVMLMDLSYGGTLKPNLFKNIIASSPYLPTQHFYNDSIPTQLYSNFASYAGCGDSPDVFSCLVSKPSKDLQEAEFKVTFDVPQGHWPFLPVTDGIFVQDRPSRQLLRGKTNARNALVASNSNEGSAFVPQNVTTGSILNEYLNTILPLFSPTDLEELLATYPSNDTPVDPSSPLFATLGDSGPTAINQSSVAVGQQQRANNIYAETTFVCPAYWILEAYGSNGKGGKKGYKYEYSVPVATHGRDTDLIFGPLEENQSAELAAAVRNMLGNFIVTDNPSIPQNLAGGGDPSVNVDATHWPTYSVEQPFQLNINETGGVPYQTSGIFGTVGIVTQYREPGLMNNFRLVNAQSWEGGRGKRCNFWRRLSSRVPE